MVGEQRRVSHPGSDTGFCLLFLNATLREAKVDKGPGFDCRGFLARRVAADGYCSSEHRRLSYYSSGHVTHYSLRD